MKKIATLLIIVITILCLAGAFIPQASDKSPQFIERWKRTYPLSYSVLHFLQLDRVFSSYLFVVSIFLLFLVLSYFLYLQIKLLFKSSMKVSLKKTCFSLNGFKSVRLDGKTEVAHIANFFRDKGYRTVAMEGNRILFARHGIGKFGTLIFHAGILLVILGALYYAGFHKRGFVQLIKGDTFSGRGDDFLVKDLGLFRRNFDIDFQVRLVDFKHEYWGTGELKNLSSTIITANQEDRFKKWVIVPNAPLNYRGISIYQSFNYGYTLSFLLKKPSGEEVLCHFSLDISPHVNKPMRGVSDYPLTAYIFDMEFYPDKDRSSFYLKKPMLKLSIMEGNERKFEGVMEPGSEMEFEGGRLKFLEIRNWSGLIFTLSPGKYFFYTGFILIIAGAFFIYFLPASEIICVLEAEDGRRILYLKGFTKRYHALFNEEMEGLIKELAGRFS